MSSPKPPKPTASQIQQESEQAQASALLDQQENERRKRLLNAAAGMRAFNGSAMGRAAPSNLSPSGPSASQQVGGPFAAPSTGASTGAAAGGGGAPRAFAKP